ncbi:hypothetical protein ABTG32_18120, partial [Acinetobacter baumannii]
MGARRIGDDRFGRVHQVCKRLSRIRQSRPVRQARAVADARGCRAVDGRAFGPITRGRDVARLRSPDPEAQWCLG